MTKMLRNLKAVLMKKAKLKSNLIKESELTLKRFLLCRRPEISTGTDTSVMTTVASIGCLVQMITASMIVEYAMSK